MCKLKSRQTWSGQDRTEPTIVNTNVEKGRTQTTWKKYQDATFVLCLASISVQILNLPLIKGLIYKYCHDMIVDFNPFCYTLLMIIKNTRSLAVKRLNRPITEGGF